MTNFGLPLGKQMAGRTLTLGTIVASIAFVMELTLLPLTLTAIKSDLALSVRQLAWVFNAYAIAVAGAVFLSGLVGDRLGRVRLFSVGVVLFVVGSGCAALSEGDQTLILSRIIQGLGGGLFFPLVPVLLTQANSEKAGHILMIWGGLLGIAAAALPLGGATFLGHFGWQSIFVAFGAVALLGLFLVAAGDGDIETRSPVRLASYKKLLSLRGYWLLLGYIFLTYGCFSFFLFHFPITWQKNGFDSQQVSVFLSSTWLAFSVLSFLLRNKLEGKGLGRSLLLAPALLAVSFASAIFDQGQSQFQLLSGLLAGAGLACCNSPSTHLLLRISPHDLRAFSSSLDIIFARCGSVAIVASLAAMSPAFIVLCIASLSAIAMLASRFFLDDEIAPESVTTKQAVDS